MIFQYILMVFLHVTWSWSLINCRLLKILFLILNPLWVIAEVNVFHCHPEFPVPYYIYIRDYLRKEVSSAHQRLHNSMVTTGISPCLATRNMSEYWLLEYNLIIVMVTGGLLRIFFQIMCTDGIVLDRRILMNINSVCFNNKETISCLVFYVVIW